jgi:hypothetical protein
MQGKTAIANILKQEGVDVAFCFPKRGQVWSIVAPSVGKCRFVRGKVHPVPKSPCNHKLLSDSLAVCQPLFGGQLTLSM